MNKGMLIVVEGTDCSGKETQSNKLIEKLKKDGYQVYKMAFPDYDSPTGKIIGGPYLGKPHIGEGWFSEGAAEVDPLVASAYYAADRRYHINTIKEYLKKGYIVLLDRYVESNMGHQASKILDKEERYKMYDKLDNLEYNVMELPRPDVTVFLYMPYEYACILRQSREEKPDQLESCQAHLKQAEMAYLELCEKYNFLRVDCVSEDAIKSIDEINNDVYRKVKNYIDENK